MCVGRLKVAGRYSVLNGKDNMLKLLYVSYSAVRIYALFKVGFDLFAI